MVYPEPTAQPPPIAPGTVLHLNPGDWYYGRGADPTRPTEVRVRRMRRELSRYYGGVYVWIDGHAPDCRDDHHPCRDLLVRTSALHQPRHDSTPN